jgi:hypothetical protein
MHVIDCRVVEPKFTSDPDPTFQFSPDPTRKLGQNIFTTYLPIGTYVTEKSFEVFFKLF